MAGSSIRRGCMFGCGGPKQKVTLLFRNPISPLRRGFRISGPACVLRWVCSMTVRLGLLFLLVLVLGPSLARETRIIRSDTLVAAAALQFSSSRLSAGRQLGRANS